jgi:hypothetical protein
MSTRLIASLVVVVVLAACGSDAPGEAAASPSASTTTITQPGATPLPLSEVPATPSVAPPDFTLFIAAVDAALADTSYAGAALTDPEVFIATGRLFCQLLDEGMTSDGILSEHLDALAAVNAGEVADDDAIATGVVLGASTGAICPQHAG